MLGQRRGGLRLAQHQVAALAEREREELERAFLQLGREVDQHVSAQRQVDPWERRSLAQVVLPEHDHAADGLVHLEVGTDRREVAADELVGDVGE